MKKREVIKGLQYIAESPSYEHGGFHPQTVEVAKAAIAILREHPIKNTRAVHGTYIPPRKQKAQ